MKNPQSQQPTTRALYRAVVITAAVLATTSILAPAAFAGSAAAEDHRTIDDCTVINSSGSYDITSDIQTGSSGACIEIRADNVTIYGVDHTITGPGSGTESAGIDLSGAGGDVQIQRVEIHGFGHGVQAGYGAFSNLHLSRVDAVGNGLGAEADYTTGTITITDSSLSRNSGSGFAASSASHVEIANTDLANNGASGIRTTETSQVTLDRVRIEGNDGSGISVGGHGGTYDISDSTIRENGGRGVEAFSSADHLSVSDTRFSGNGDVDVKSDIDTTLDGVELSRVAEVHFDGGPVTLDRVPADGLPEYSEGRTHGGGVEWSGERDTARITLELDAHGRQTVDVLHHDGDWRTVSNDARAEDGSVQHNTATEGVYAVGEEGEDRATPTQTPASTPTDTATATATPTQTETATPASGSETPGSDSSASRSTATPTATETPGSSSPQVSYSAQTATAAETEAVTQTSGETTAASATQSAASTSTQTDAGETATENESLVVTEGVAGDTGGDGAGFGSLAALAGLLAAALLAWRRA